MSHLPRRLLLIFVFCLSVLLFSSSRDAHADENPSLRTKIDQLLHQTQAGPIAEIAHDSTFVRRIYLDLVGRIPTVNETKSFLADQTPEKRTALVDQLLASDEFNQHMAVSFDLMLMERRGGKHVKQEEFRKYLEDSFKNKKSYLELTKEILAADGTAEKIRPAAAFYLERDVAPDLLTREIGRVFFGVDLQCAQCHNHPNIDDYHQEDYYGLQAFIVRTSLFQPDKKKPALIAEKAEGEAAFNSVFTSRSSMTGPRILNGEELVEVSFKPGERYQVAPAKNIRHIPTESRLAKLATATTAKPTDSFNRNIANRLWAHMLGRGLVHPVDLHHSANPPSHPALLELISEDIAARNYDVKSFLREIALSEVYQRDSTLKLEVVDIKKSQKQISDLEALADEQLELSYQADEVVDASTEKLDAAFAEMKPLQAEIEKANKVIADALKVRDAAKVKHDKTAKSIADQQKVSELVVKAREQSKVASEALKDDKELASATAILLKKTETLATALLKIQEAEKKEKAELDKAEASLKATYPAADAAVAKSKPVEEKVRQLRTELISKRQIAANYREASAVATQKAEALKTLVEFSQLQAKVEELSLRIPQLVEQLKVDQAQVPELMKAVAAKQVLLVAAQQAMQKADELVKAATLKLENEKTTAALLNESLARLKTASQRIEGEEPLKAAKIEIATSIEEFKKKIELSQNGFIAQQANLKAQADIVATATKVHQTSQAVLTKQQAKVAQQDAVIKQSQTELEKTKSAIKSIEESIIVQSSARLKLFEVVQLNPEQLGWSMLIATGQRDRQRAAEASKLNKEKPLSPEDLKDPAKVTAREQQIDEATQKAIATRVATFLPLYGAGAGQPQHNFFATADQALFLSNGNELKSWLAPADGNLTDRLNTITSVEDFAKELYLSVYCRVPTAEESQLVEEYLQIRKEDKPAAIQELAWALLSSAEFRFQY